MALRRGLGSLPSAQRQTYITRRAVVTLTRANAMASNGNGDGEAKAASPSAPRNVLGGPLQCCCTAPRTGYYRDGYCRTDASDVGRHVICAQVTAEFLTFSRSLGNDLMTPAPAYGFPGLKPGDKWCLCANRWKEAMLAGKAPPVFLSCTHIKALETVSLEDLLQHAAKADPGAPDPDSN